jgi:glutamate-1-semialdehyde 2,1-aminomutase
MQGSAGAIAGQPEFLQALRDACSRHGVLLVFDEVMTSRLAPGGLQGKHGIRPDLTTLGKYVGGGMTIGAFGGDQQIMDRFDPARPDAFPHGGTFNNNVLAMAAGLAGFTQVLSDAALNRMNALGDDLRERANALAARHGIALQATGIGSIFAIHFHRGAIRNVQDLAAGSEGRAREIGQLKTLFQFDLLQRGLYVTRRILGNLSLASTEADVDRFIDAVDEFLASRGALIRQVAP